MYYDLHIHSALSPCAGDEMTPGNVCAMAALKDLGIIAVTDHNSAGNLRAFSKVCRAKGILLLPGIEVCTSEEVHVLAYFPTVSQAERMGDWCRQQLMGQKNKPDFFGRQRLLDWEDRVTGEEDALLIGALAADLNQVCGIVRALDGVPVPAHVYRSYGLMKVLGFFPPEAGFRAAEAGRDERLPEGMTALCSSDAHELGAIAEPEQKLPLKTRSAQSVLALLRDGIP
ncbi:MAG: PHP domain-containing protein [Eubacteriales bacterium]|nr:PHP domain-containing protein [Eubacteriales bacterium]